ncbi:YdcH family protein [Sphingopyxis sp.]|uniref:YdcH family protein n=1 Tax=Sphingopyxis sp. TaxID=1908224 RepID=UPI003BAAFA62
MSETGHDLHSLFPDHGPALHALKLKDAHFRTLAEQHHEVTLEIQRIEDGRVAASDVRIEALKKQRLQLLVEVSGLVAAHEAA